MVFNHDLAADMLSHGANAGDVGLILACVLFWKMIFNKKNATRLIFHHVVENVFVWNMA